MVDDYKRTEGAVAIIERERYVSHPEKNTAACINHFYRGKGMTRCEILTSEASDDVYTAPRVRFSYDNGRTWGEWTPDPASHPEQGDYSIEYFDLFRVYDPCSGKMLRIIFQRIFKGDPPTAISMYFKNKTRLFWDHAFCQLSEDDGLTWGSRYLVKFEEGADFDEDNWGKVEYLEKNCMYSGYNVVPASDGGLVYSAVVAMPHREEETEEIVDGILCLKGTWDKKSGTYVWRPTQRLSVSGKVSSRGLMEPWLAELKDGTIMLEMRGSSTEWTPGRKWYSVSRDRGNTWSSVSDLRYDTGEQFYAPSTFAKMIRSSLTGKLYWVGNISAVLPNGNWPRRPLYIAELDEEKVALRKETLTVIDDYEPGRDATEYVQFSNFSLLEDRKTGQLEMYLTRYGEFGELSTGKYFESDVFKYVLTLK